MATWQFQIELIPRQWAEESNFDVEALYDSEGHDSSTAWENYSSPIDLEQLVSEILPKNESWHSDLKVWGKTDSNDIQVW